uniref:Uncharacterized protein n=1 Tax=Grammatophora oceanica TaxID=210454 RepID=A0A7S1UWE5_9STRA|mmetsp:Transcript_26760/g.39114  ORF Transcript_26760/g.39114 Transcript_26760/m.39114 type:complete len:170 (+) Transcript_26760:44-553(+)|eukprot:CAMPEP_0194026766 /NCGR_PEP_ID=MMETSP0009_2-20130614/1042_1 /TAXON_ID=210454 /ORGANISM="Grammatophora oceanica, Strain CCMP 410" /LENGTH=169 /DNA_ID=CAMNT_0038665611 /DNA_START=32 /DNA_END=541 /DNA_ORIENTATION=-
MLPLTIKALALTAAVTLLSSLPETYGWTTSIHQAKRTSSVSRSRFLAATTGDNELGVQTISLDSLTDDHEAEGTRLSESIVKWLDAEWIPQDVHVKMGESAKKSYIGCRSSGESELMSIMTQVADDLTSKWSEYDADAFVNAWDIANYVSDYLTERSGTEGCECNSKIY